MSSDPRDHFQTYEEYIRNLAEETDRLAGKGDPVAVDPEVADHMGAFKEEALSPEDALESIEITGEVDYNG
ncbi:MAG: hypothetical protein HWE30_17785 [Methylocystaceae bacterium]|nr:hypothetical protein [Methylocystaceae bacterium]